MSPEERVAVLWRAVGALRAIEAERRTALPPPEREDPALLREIREFASLADRLEMELAFDGYGRDEVYGRDASLSMGYGRREIEFLRAVTADPGVGTPYRGSPLAPEPSAALEALVALLSRYEAGDFMPPRSYFGIVDAEA